MSDRKERIEELVSLYSVGAITDDELDELDKYIADNPDELESLLEEHERIASLLSHSAEEVIPPPQIKDNLLRKIRIRKQAERRSRETSAFEKLKPLWFGLCGAAATAAIVFIFSGTLAGYMSVIDDDRYKSLVEAVERKEQQIAILRSDLQEKAGEASALENEAAMLSARLESMAKELEEKENTIQALSSELEETARDSEMLRAELELKEDQINEFIARYARYEELIDFLQNPDVVVVDLGNLKEDINSLGRVLWNKKRDSAIFWGLNLPSPPPDKIYQLWAIVDSQPVSYGIFDVDEDGDGVIRLERLEDTSRIQQFAVTLEPEGGVPQPTGEMYLAGGI